MGFRSEIASLCLGGSRRWGLGFSVAPFLIQRGGVPVDLCILNTSDPSFRPSTVLFLICSSGLLLHL